jgi:ligand-binding sensor domain-containing protein
MMKSPMNMIKLNLRRLSIFLAFFLFPLAAFAQQWTHYTVADGLPPWRIYAIYEDHDGNLWFGASGGACRFDGFRFRMFTEEDGLAIKDWREEVYAIFRDSAGYLWFGTSAGVSRFDGKEFRNFTTKDGLAYNGVNAIYEDSKGNLWFGTGVAWYGGGNGISRYDGKEFKSFTPQDGLLPGEVFSIIEDRKGDLWISTRNGISRYDGKMFQNYTKDNGLPCNDVRASCIDRAGNLWFGLDAHPGGYVYKYDGSNFLPADGLGQFKSNPVRLIEDQQGNLWIGTWENGVGKYDGKHLEVYTTDNGLPNNSVFSIYQDSSGNIWFGTADGVVRYDYMSFRNYAEKDGLDNRWVSAAYKDHRGNLWFATRSEDDAIFQFRGNRFEVLKNSQWGNDALCIREDHAGNLWFGIDYQTSVPVRGRCGIFIKWKV